MELAGRKPVGPKQQSLDLNVERQTEVNGLEMGVLSDGTPFLTGRALALLCGVHYSVIADIASDWNEAIPKARISAIRDILSARGFSYEKPYVASWQKGSATFFAYPDAVCIAVLEYYAFDAGGNTKENALKNYRALAGQALREFIYKQLGYDPNTNVPQLWRQFHDRMSLVYNAVPAGYFGIFKEIGETIVTLGQAGLHIDDTFVPDISVGQQWAKHWAASFYDAHYGLRIRFDHKYPEYFPQAASNPQEAWLLSRGSLGRISAVVPRDVHRRRQVRDISARESKRQATACLIRSTGDCGLRPRSKSNLTLIAPCDDGFMRVKTECVEGPEAAIRFDAMVRKILSVPHDEIMRREAEYKRQSAANPNRRGPKPKIKPPA
jgi:hypothetical protein